MHIFVNFSRMIRECLHARMPIANIENICALAFNCVWLSRELASFFREPLYICTHTYTYISVLLMIFRVVVEF